MSTQTWRKSSRSAAKGNCVEVAHTTSSHTVGVRDSKNPAGPTLAVPPTGWAGFVAGVKAGSLA